MVFWYIIDEEDYESKFDELLSMCGHEYYLSHNHNGWIGTRDKTCKYDCKGWNGIQGDKCDCGNKSCRYLIDWIQGPTQRFDDNGYEYIEFAYNIIGVDMYDE